MVYIQANFCYAGILSWLTIIMGTYRNYMKLLESWPLDKSKVGSDLSQHIRDQIKIAFAKGEASRPADREKCDRYYMSLKRICSNHYGQLYPRIRSETGSGLTREQCNIVLTPEYIKYLNEQPKGIISGVVRGIVAYYYHGKTR